MQDSAPTYQLVTPPAEDPVSLDELKAWLKITGNAQDDILTNIIKAVTKSAELFTKREFIEKEFKTYRNCFCTFIELRRTPVQSISSVKYINSADVLTTVAPSTYYFTTTDGSEFSNLTPNPSQSWPADILLSRLQAVEIVFTAGWPTAAIFKENWPDLYQALLAHMAYVFVNRGDCSIADGCSCANAPGEAMMVYELYRIIDFASAY